MLDEKVGVRADFALSVQLIDENAKKLGSMTLAGEFPQSNTDRLGALESSVANFQLNQELQDSKANTSDLVFGDGKSSGLKKLVLNEVLTSPMGREIQLRMHIYSSTENADESFVLKVSPIQSENAFAEESKAKSNVDKAVPLSIYIQRPTESKPGAENDLVSNWMRSSLESLMGPSPFNSAAKPSDASSCVTKLASKPYCMTLATAELNCENVQEADVIQACLDEYMQKTGSPNMKSEFLEACLVGSSSSSEPAKNKSLCNPE